MENRIQSTSGGILMEISKNVRETLKNSIVWKWREQHKQYKNPERDAYTDICDWCGMAYPKGGWKYYELTVFGTDHHVICSDCYEHLTLVTCKGETQ
jgi:hypothetical protein